MKGRFLSLLTSIGLFGASTGVAQAAEPSALAPARPTVYQVRSEDGPCLDAAGNSGEVVQTWWDCNRTRAQKWRFESLHGGVRIVHARTDTCATLVGRQSADIVLKECEREDPEDSQTWRVTPDEGARRRYQNLADFCWLRDAGSGRPVACVHKLPATRWTVRKS
ncbi:RICIN domain-containing protein [Streptomyces sp. NPDC018019]|uniref:RICIN domain-containing protein n=1 Tax=Streptomyces sp. NPDC018019 TaxID=3365030 RepID=UPI00378AAC2A